MVILEHRSGAYSIVCEHRSAENCHLQQGITRLERKAHAKLLAFLPKAACAAANRAIGTR